MYSMDFDVEQSTPENRKFSSILRQAGFNKRPIWYAGTPANGLDINSGKLETLYELLHENYGEKAAHSYVRMVALIPYLAPTDFVKALWDLKKDDWHYRGNVSMNGLSTQTDDTTFVSSVSVLFGQAGVNDTESIRKPFVRNHFAILQKAADDGDMCCKTVVEAAQRLYRDRAFYRDGMHFVMNV